MIECTEFDRRRIETLNTALVDILDYFNKETVTDVMVNPDGRLWVDDLKDGKFDSGKLISVPKRMQIISLVADACDKVCNEESPSLSANLPQTRFRFQGEIPPVCEAPFFVVRKPAILQFSLEDYVLKGEMTHRQKSILTEAAQTKKNLLIVGGTGSGKTTLGNAFLAEICKVSCIEPRIFIIEDSMELVSLSKDTTRLLTVGHKFDTSHRLRTCMRSNPERIIVGEIRDGRAALGLLKTLNSGHPGGFTTIHADSAEKGLKKLLQYVAETVENPNPSIVSEAIDIVVYMERSREGRKVKEIIELDSELNNGAFIFRSIQ